MVAEQVILRVRPGEKVRFPGLCVHCGRPASDKIVLMRKSGQLTRRLDAPICAECARQLSRRSGKEERLLRMSWPAAIGAAVLLAGMIFLILSFDTLWLRMSIAALVGLAGGAVVRWAIARRAALAELPEKRAVSDAARIVDFSWRDMILAFENANFAEQVRALNREVLAGAEDAPGEAAGEQA
ncbi:MAG TPA: hypothetical protein VF434_09325 [Promineifilum sp.]